MIVAEGTAVPRTRERWAWVLCLLGLPALAVPAGVDPTSYKVTSFVLSAAGAGIAGALWATMRDGLGLVQPDQFNFQFSFDAIAPVALMRAHKYQSLREHE